MTMPSTQPASPGQRRPSAGFAPPDYPYDRLEQARRVAESHPGGVVDLSVGTPGDPPPQRVLDALAGVAPAGERRSVPSDSTGAARGYPPSAGTAALRQAISDWFGSRLAVEVPPADVAACVGTKEFVATLPQWLHLRWPGRDVVLYPALSYPTYEMGALLAGLTPVAVPVEPSGRLRLDELEPDVISRALLLWVNSPGNPAGQLEDLAAVASWGRRHQVLVVSDECYLEYTWDGAPRSVLGHGGGKHGLEGVLAVHSLSKRSNMAGLRVGWYAGDPEVVAYLIEVRKHAGFMVPGPVQAAAVAALADQSHVEHQRSLYLRRLERMRKLLPLVQAEADMPQGGFYLWAEVPGGDEWAFTSLMAERAGALVSPGSFYGQAGRGHVRLAMVAPMERLDLLARRLQAGD